LKGLSLSGSASPSGYELRVETATTIYTLWTDATVSDVRVKRNIRDSEIDALTALCAVPVRSFEWSPKAVDHHNMSDPYVPIGIVSQELQRTVPYAVRTSEGLAGDDTQHIIHQHLTAYLIRAIQQLVARVEALEASA
jgi:hypothetical protein